MHETGIEVYIDNSSHYDLKWDACVADYISICLNAHTVTN